MPTPERIFSQQAWEKLLAESIEQINKLSALKGGEYAGDHDRLANFRRNAKALGLMPEQVWAVYAGKHWDAVMQYIQDRAAGTSRLRLESMSGRLDDLIVYALLFKAMLIEAETDQVQQVVSAVARPFEEVCQHDWRVLDRHTDICSFCNTMRPHGRSR